MDCRLREYEIHTEYFPSGRSLRAALLSDLHGHRYGRNQEELIKMVTDARPDIILAAGDMINRQECESFRSAFVLMKALAEKFPVFYSMGNHEAVLCEKWGMENAAGKKIFRTMQAFPAFEKKLTDAGVTILHNSRTQIDVKGCRADIAGLSLPLAYYSKRNPPRRCRTGLITELLGPPGHDRFQILMAHSPRYAPAYFRWGADMTVSGHYHGGVMRLTDRHGCISSYFELLPPWCVGDFHCEGKHLFVSPGLGEHTIPVRIHNPREVYLIRIRGTGKPGSADSKENDGNTG